VSHLAAAGAQPPAKVPQDDAIQALARQALASPDAAFQKEALRQIRTHRFHSTRAPQREYALFVQGILEDRFEDALTAAVSLRKLERIWPNSAYLPEAQCILGQEAIERRRFKEAESRLRKALQADIPVEGKRRAQELLMWALVEQAHPEQGLPILESLHPLGTTRPSERGLVAMTEILATAKRRDQAESARKDYHTLYPRGSFGPRVDLACGRMLGALGEARGSAEILRRIIQASPNAPEADEARLALASLLSEGKLNPKEAKDFPDPNRLLGEIRRAEKKGDMAQRSLLVRLRMSMNASHWKEAVDLAAQIRATGPGPDEATVVARLRADAFRAWAQELLGGQQIDPILPYLDGEGIQSLTAEQRRLLAQRLARVGLVPAALTLMEAAPPSERTALKKGILESTSADIHPAEALKAMSGRGESAEASLKRAQAALALKDWKTARAALGRAKPCGERIQAITTLLRRPPEGQEAPAIRVREAEGWLARCREKGGDREPLVLLVADLRARVGDWKGALALYPSQPSKAQQGWVALMRATCQARLGKKEAARATLQQAANEPGFRMEREGLARQLK